MDLTYLYKYFYGAIDVDLTSKIKAIHVNSSHCSSDQGFKLNESLVKTETFRNSYFYGVPC